MPFVDNDGIKIHYHVEGNGPTLVMQHGYTSSIVIWYLYGYVDRLKDNNRLALVDARGHGKSDKPYDPAAYAPELRVSDVTAVMDDLNVDKAHYLGYSMGGMIGFGLARYAPERMHSFILGGMHPYPREPGAPSHLGSVFKTLEQGVEAYVETFDWAFGPLSVERKTAMLANDGRALLAARGSGGGLPDNSDLVPGMTLPCLVFAGEEDELYDGAKKVASELPNARFVSLPGRDHVRAYIDSEDLLLELESFLKEANAAVAAG